MTSFDGVWISELEHPALREPLETVLIDPDANVA